METLDELIAALRGLPTIGPKTARRLALHLLQRDRSGAEILATSLQQALQTLKPCTQCRQLSLSPLCDICSDEERQQATICVVESLDDLYLIEQTGVFEGRYYVLNGHLSPLDGIGPEELGIPQLLDQVAAGGIDELILALNPQVEGEATAQYIHDQIKSTGVKISRLAQGIPLGKELSRLDPATLSMALSGRTEHHD
ncbi:recombination mediator RecR [Salinispirillum sp. LH 10-3-1]|uniref:Recombination protein RecR n=1 Tax=Salinispirillum sp. LH 10-3-1 TaxID=2952525 RepID=A0AB38YJK7_9GAMM